MPDLEERLNELEIRLAHQEHIIDELSTQLAAQWKQVDYDRHRFDVLTKRFIDLEQNSDRDIPITKPPHY